MLLPRRFHSLLIAPALLPLFMLIGSGASDNNPPVAVNDSYTIHGCARPLKPEITANDSDPDGDSFFIDAFPQLPAHGGVSRGAGNSVSYCANYGYIGSDSFTYEICDTHSACTTGTVDLNVLNQAPTGGTDSYNVHGATVLGPFLVNDSDPDGDSVTCGDAAHECILTFPLHGGLSGVTQPDKKSYGPNYGYTGPDSFTYNACDGLGLCTPTTVNISVDNNAPDAVDDAYTVSGSSTTIGPFLENDSDPDGDNFGMGGTFQESIVTFPQHGSLSGLAQPDLKLYSPNQGYSGIDSFVYATCDELGKCSTATVTLDVNPAPSPTPTPTPTPDDDKNLGEECPTQLVGRPVNVTNGNMYLQQTDYRLPGVGEEINFTRTYNSMSSRSGLFGKGWSTGYDEVLVINSPTSLRLYMPDGRATDFVGDGSGSFVPVQTDFFGQINRNAVGTFSLSFKDGRVHVFNGFGALLSLSDRNNNQTTLSYDGSGKLTSVTDPSGRSVSFTTDTNGRILSISDTIGTIATYTYGGGHELLSVFYADNSGFQFNYDGNDRLASVNDALGNVLESHEYDSQGRALTSEKQGGVERYSLNYVSDSETDVTDALGHVTKYFFDKSTSRNVVTRVEGLCSCGSGSQSQTWTYDNNLNILSHSNSLNQTTTYTYDGQGNQLTMTGAAGTTTTTYNQLGQPLTATDAMGSTTLFTYNGQGSPLSITDPLNKVTAFTSDSRGELLTITDARGQPTSFAYDATGNLITQTDALGHATQFAYDQRGRLTRATNALGQATAFAYDGVGRVKKVTQADGTVISYEYDLAGRRTRITDALNNSTNFSYDAAYRMTTLTDALGNTRNYAYDLMSNLTSMTDVLGRTTSYQYDDFNRLSRVIYPPNTTGATPLQESVDYDAAGNVTSRTDTAGRLTSLQYDAANRLVRVVDPALGITQYEYNPRSNVTAVVDALGQRYTFDYDALGRLTTATRAGLQMSFGYDAVGNRTRRTDFNGMSTNYAYDALNRLTNISYPDASTASYTFDQLSRLTAASNLNGTVTFSYDNRGRISSTTDVFGQMINYSYDANGNRTKMSFGATTNATYSYDALNRLTTITDDSGLSVDYAYDPMSRLISQTLPNGIVASYAYDGLDRLTRLQDVKDKKVLADNNYRYDAAGNIIQNVDQSGPHNYGYDALDRLTAASHPATGNEGYVYDAVGNRTSSQSSASYTYQPFNRLVGTSAANYLYDNNGNLISRTDSNGTTQFAWDFENRLTQVVTPSAGSVSYKYDALGRRVQRAPASGVSAKFVYDGQDVVRDLNSDGSTVDYLNGPGIDNKIRQSSTSGHKTTTLYYLTDHLGSTTALTNARGRVVEQIGYDSFGNSAGSANTRYGFTGRERDSLTGLVDYRARSYDPQVGRFISEDPIGFAGGDVNFYAYVGNNSVGFKDPTGLWSPEAHREIIHRAFKGCLSEAQMDILIDASDYVDGLFNGGAWREEYAYQHGMRASDESVEHARNAANQFISNQERKAAENRRSFDQRSPLLTGGITVGLNNFGQALHTITDMFSPAHQGFQVWHGPPIPTGITPVDVRNAATYASYVRRHQAQETLDELLRDPARLDRIIKAARDAFSDTFGKSACECAN
jgi:RHS repeat-associated protein